MTVDSHTLTGRFSPARYAGTALWLAVLLGVTVSACSGPRLRGDAPADLPDAFPYHTATQIRAQVHSAGDSLWAFRGKASLALRSPARKGSFNADIHARRGDSTYLTISPGFGIEAARALVTRDSFFVYDRINNELAYGAVADAGDLLPAPFTTDDIFPNLLGIISPVSNVDWQVEADSMHYVLKDPAGLRKYIIDPARWRVVQYEERTEEGELVEQRTYGEFDVFNGLYLPRRLILRRPLDDVIATVYYRDLSLNPSELSFELGVRSGVERILVD